MRRPGYHSPIVLRRSALLPASMVVLLTIAACSSGSARLAPGTPTPSDKPRATAQSSPYPFTTPLPLAVSTAIDGWYAKIDPKPGTPVPCLRCPDYVLEGGAWQLSFDKGIYRIFHAPTGWRSVGSYTVSEDQVTLFNDPVCHAEVGIYAWTVEHGMLSLREIKDACAIHLRAVNLTRQSWASCRPPNAEAAVTDHWIKPAGCLDTAIP